MAMCYEKYFIPTRVVNEFRNKIQENITIPIIKRKLSAMIHATMSTRVSMGNNIFRHNYGSIELIVEEETKIIREVSHSVNIVPQHEQNHMYRKVCWSYGLNKDKNII